jgi:hypothetical protein
MRLEELDLIIIKNSHHLALKVKSLDILYFSMKKNSYQGLISI